MDYTKFDVEDFASDEYFIDWVNQRNPEAEKFWLLFLSEYPEFRPKVDKARVLVLNLQRAQNTYHDRSQIDAIWNKVQKKIETDQIVLSANLIKIIAALGSAASPSLAQTAFESTIEEAS